MHSLSINIYITTSLIITKTIEMKTICTKTYPNYFSKKLRLKTKRSFQKKVMESRNVNSPLGTIIDDSWHIIQPELYYLFFRNLGI